MMSPEDKLSFYLDKSDALDRVTELINTRLIDCGWRDQVRLACRKAISENPDKNLTVNDMVQLVTANARGMVPDSVKRELLHELENTLLNINNASIEVDVVGNKK